VYSTEAVFFSKTAMVTFGGAYSVLAYVADEAVEKHHWLLPGEMLDGLGMAETTPGPLIQVVQFVGFMGAYRSPRELSPLAAGVAGSIITTWVTYCPCFLWIFLGAPYIEYLRGRAALNAALSTITAAVVGVVLNLSIWFAIHTLFRAVQERSYGPVNVLSPDWRTLDPLALAISLAAFIAIFRFKLGMLQTLAASALMGLAFYLIAH
jgi:chromate transporter